MRISFIGAGRVAHHLAAVLSQNHQIVQIYSRTYTNTLMMLGVEERERDYMLKHKINDVSVHYEDLSLMLEENLQMYENRVLSLVKADTVEE